jgi:hypothetical protein
VARIRTIKPEAFISESLAEVSVEAERTFFGLLTQADDHGRHRDNAAIIAGVLWPLRAEHTPVHVEDDLAQLAAAGLICRYTGCDGRRYLHVVTWGEHQRIDRASVSRMPACPDHHRGERCGPCQGPCTHYQPPPAPAPQPAGAPRTFNEGPPSPRGALDRALQAPDGAREAECTPVVTAVGPCPAGDDALVAAAGPSTGELAGQGGFDEPSPKARRGFAEGSASGSRILDPGSSFPSGRDAPGVPVVSAQQLVAGYVVACGRRPPKDVLGHLGRVVAGLLGEGIDLRWVRAGLARYAEIQGHPSRLPSLVNDAMNAPAGAGGLVRPGSGSTVPARTGFACPADPAAYAEEL